MNKKLFIICPFSNLEQFLRNKFGFDSFFISAPAGMIPTDDNQSLENLKMAIMANCINEVYIVNEVSNPLILSLIREEGKKDILFLNQVAELREEFWLKRLAGLSQSQQALKMAELVNEKSIELLESYLNFKSVEEAKSITLRGLVISNNSGFIKESRKMNRYKIAYGL